MTLGDLAKMVDAVQSVHGTDEPLVWVMGNGAKCVVASVLLDSSLTGGKVKPIHLTELLGHRVVIDPKADPRHLYWPKPRPREAILFIVARVLLVAGALTLLALAPR